MKKTFLFLSLAFALSAGFTSCSESNDIADSGLIIEGNIMEKGVSCDLVGGYLSIPVISTGNWNASLPEDCDWAMIVSAPGTGNGTVTVFVESNYTNEIRTTTVSVTNGNDRVNIPLSQDNTLDGNPIENASSDSTSFYDVAASKGLGMGFNLLNGSRCNSIFNIMAIRYISNNDFSYYNTYNEGTQTITDANEASTDSIEIKHDILSIKLSCDIAYGLFKMRLSGGYHGGEDKKTTAWHWQKAAKYELGNAYFDIDNVLAIAETANSEDFKDLVPDAEMQKYYKSVYTPGFNNKRKAVIAACKEGIDTTNYKSDKTLVKVLKQLIDSYGVAVTTETTLGGSFALDLYCDSIYVKEEMGIDSAKAAVAITSGLFSLDAKVAADYQKQSTDILNHSTYTMLLKGGTSTTQTGIQKCFENKEFDKINDAVKEWVSTLKLTSASNQNNVDVVKVTTRPIWLLFDDPNVAEIVEKYIKDTYPGIEKIITQ